MVHDAVRSGLADHLAPGDLVRPAARRPDPGDPGQAPGNDRRRVARRGARQDPARAPDRGDEPDRRAAVRAVLRLGRFDAALADPARRDARLDRRRRPRRPALAERPRRARLDRSMGRPRRRRLRRVRARAPNRPAQPGLEGLVATPSAGSTGRSPRRRSPWPRSRATSSTPSSGSPGSPAGAATPTSRIGSRRRPRTSRNASPSSSGCRTGRSRWRSTAPRSRSTRSARTPGTASGAGSSRRSTPPRSPRRSAPRRWCPAGACGPMAPASRATTRSAITPGRSGHTTRRSPPPVSAATASTTPPTRSRAGCSPPPSTSRPSGCPELFCGFDRASTGSPIAYPVACSPQAWAAGSALMLIRTMLGLQADAPNGRLTLDRPILPAGLTKVVVRGIRVGELSCDLLLHRWRGLTSAEVLRKDAGSRGRRPALSFEPGHGDRAAADRAGRTAAGGRPAARLRRDGTDRRGARPRARSARPSGHDVRQRRFERPGRARRDRPARAPTDRLRRRPDEPRSTRPSKPVLERQDDFDLIHAHVERWNLELGATRARPGRLDVPRPAGPVLGPRRVRRRPSRAWSRSAGTRPASSPTWTGPSSTTA